MNTKLLDDEAVRRALSLRDLTDPDGGPHAMQLLLDGIESALTTRWRRPVRRHRLDPVVTTADNYDRLRYPPEGVARDVRYTRYLNNELVLRTQTSAMIPPLLERLAAGPPGDVVLSCPGIVYRADSIDRHHVGEPHQVDLWRVRTVAPSLGPRDLEEMIETVLGSTLPKRRYRTVPAQHPYTLEGLQIDAEEGTGWVEVGECGLAHPEMLTAAGLSREASGLAVGLGLDRLMMLRKGLDDIRLLRSSDPRIAAQMLDLAPYRPVSSMPPVRRDLSIAVSGEVDAEALGDRVREALGPQATSVESVDVLSVTPAEDLPAPARARIGIGPGQTNALVRIVLRDLDRTLTSEEANLLRDRIYAALHEGDVHQWASCSPQRDNRR